MNVKLRPETEQRVADHVSRQRHYASADAFVEQAVQSLLDADEAEVAATEEIRRRIQVGEREIDAGQYVEYDESTIGQLARDVHERGLRRLRGR